MSRPQLRPLRSKPESLTDMVTDAIKEAIVGKELAPGTRVSEAMLATRLEVSKTPVREALLRMRHLGLVESNGGGLQVVQPSWQKIHDAYELRAGLERVSAKHAATRRSEADHMMLAELAAASLDCAKTADVAGFRDSDRSFHHLVATCSGNTALAAAVDEALLLTSALRLRDVPRTGDSVSCAAEHVQIARLIGTQQPELAAAAMEAHVEHVMSTVLAAVPEPGKSF
ncbi:GntR family transcriptional regulator [Streptomyces sp. NPDC000880]